MERLCLLGLSALWLAAPTAGQQVELQVYRIDAERSDVHWLVHKAGALSNLGHSHVISVGELDGEIYLYDEPSQSRVEIAIPVAGLVVDDSDLRRRQGDDFASEPTDDDVADTRRNMLSEDVLDGERYPMLRVSGSNLSIGPDSVGTIDLTVQLLDRSINLSVPARVVAEGEDLVASGAFSLTHAELGLRPFRAMLGALRVADRMDFVYRVHATRLD